MPKVIQQSKYNYFHLLKKYGDYWKINLKEERAYY